MAIVARADEIASLAARGENLVAACAILSPEETRSLQHAVCLIGPMLKYAGILIYLLEHLGKKVPCSRSLGSDDNPSRDEDHLGGAIQGIQMSLDGRNDRQNILTSPQSILAPC